MNRLHAREAHSLRIVPSPSAGSGPIGMDVRLSGTGPSRAAWRPAIIRPGNIPAAQMGKTRGRRDDAPQDRAPLDIAPRSALRSSIWLQQQAPRQPERASGSQAADNLTPARQRAIQIGYVLRRTRLKWPQSDVS